jgi:hypothetical protein
MYYTNTNSDTNNNAHDNGFTTTTFTNTNIITYGFTRVYLRNIFCLL